MTRAVVILGAGASADFGVPTLPHIFKEQHAHSYLNTNQTLKGMLHSVFWEPRGYDLESSDQSLSVEQMLTILKDWEKEDRIDAALKPQNVLEFRQGLYCLIQKAVFEGKSTNGMHLNPLIDLCRRNFNHTTWASFNWDCIFEASFWYSQPRGAGVRINPKLAIPVANWQGQSTEHTFLKLHGGINWWLVDDTITYYEFTGGGPLQRKWAEYHRNLTITERPVILEPSFYKYDDRDYRQLSGQWDFFFDKLIGADCVIIVGYSLPEMDVNARSKILTSFQINQNCRWLVIDSSEQVCDLYRKLLGSERVEILQTPLTEFNNDILSHLRTAFPSIQLS